MDENYHLKDLAKNDVETKNDLMKSIQQVKDEKSEIERFVDEMKKSLSKFRLMFNDINCSIGIEPCGEIDDDNEFLIYSLKCYETILNENEKSKNDLMMQISELNEKNNYLSHKVLLQKSQIEVRKQKMKKIIKMSLKKKIQQVKNRFFSLKVD